jgi:hypothetical protein
MKYQGKRFEGEGFIIVISMWLLNRITDRIHSSDEHDCEERNRRKTVSARTGRRIGHCTGKCL